MEALGKWMATNGESIYGSSASPIGQPPWGRVTWNAKKSTPYLHVFDWPSDARLSIDGITQPLRHAKLLHSGSEIAAVREGESLVLTLPQAAPDPIATVIRCQLET